MKKQVAIFGAGGCGRGVMPIARSQWKESGEDHELVFVDDNEHNLEMINGHKVLTYKEWVELPGSSKYINIAIADSKVRESLVKRCISDSIQFFEIRASNVLEMDDVVIGEGAILSPFVTLTSNIRIGKHFHANLYSYIEHDCIIGDYVTFAPGVKCNGNIIIEDYSYIGSGVIIKQGKFNDPVIIGEGAVVGMGAVVTKSVPSGVTVIGNPARIMKKNQGK